MEIKPKRNKSLNLNIIWNIEAENIGYQNIREKNWSVWDDMTWYAMY